MDTPLNPDGQPDITGYNYNRRVNRAINELIGMLRGIVADGIVNKSETQALAKWMLLNAEVANVFPVKPIAQRLNHIYADGIVTDEECRELKELIDQTLGQQDPESVLCGPTDFPLTKPAPDVVFPRKEFVLTGNFLYGTRKDCEHQIELLGGRCSDAVHPQTDYLIIGSLVSRDWKYTTHGTKIEKAMEYAGKYPLAIISERHWENYLVGGAGAQPASV